MSVRSRSCRTLESPRRFEISRIELDDEVFAIDGKLGDGAGAKLKSAVEARPSDDVNGVGRVDFEELAMRDASMG
jgi:hypothetical protein